MKATAPVWIVLLSVLGLHSATAGTTVSATACAKRLPDGKVVECDVAAENSKKLNDRIQAWRSIDRQYPGPSMPDLKKSQDVKEIGNDGTLITSDGTALLPAGVSCGAEATDFLRFIFLQTPKHKVVFVLSGDQTDRAKFAYVWYVESESEEQAPVPGEIRFGPFYGSINETGLTSHWCTPISQPHHRYHARYLALEKLK